MPCIAGLPSFLPRPLRVERGTLHDYARLAHLHYRPGAPPRNGRVWCVRDGTEAVAVLVLSYPPLRCAARERALGLLDRPISERCRFANRHVRTISRVVVQPQYRALGLASLLVRHAIACCPTRFVEAMAVMGRAHPLFERAGMTRFDTDPRRGDDANPAPVYFLAYAKEPFQCPSPIPLSA